jgi:hypothetical protein
MPVVQTAWRHTVMSPRLNKPPEHCMSCAAMLPVCVAPCCCGCCCCCCCCIFLGDAEGAVPVAPSVRLLPHWPSPRRSFIPRLWLLPTCLLLLLLLLLLLPILLPILLHLSPSGRGSFAPLLLALLLLGSPPSLYLHSSAPKPSSHPATGSQKYLNLKKIKKQAGR